MEKFISSPKAPLSNLLCGAFFDALKPSGPAAASPALDSIVYMLYNIAMKNDKITEICELLLNVISEFYESDSRARTFGTDTELYHSEIHMLQCIEENPGLHISGIARQLGVTRGAASQTVKRLEKKQMAVRCSSPENNKIILLRLTLKGQTAVRSHKDAHEKYRERIAEILAGATPEQLQFVAGFLRRFQKFLGR